jgi:hypothetical protein
MKTSYSTNLFGLLCGSVWSTPGLLPGAMARLLHQTGDDNHDQFHYDHNQGGGYIDENHEAFPSPMPSSSPTASPSYSYYNSTMDDEYTDDFTNSTVLDDYALESMDFGYE